ncbi:MAG: DUF1080 domain-containing protein [Planctomycetales bacterium]|nr:DUF1080 domain-containing protein [Planctomycetales bacterium]
MTDLASRIPVAFLLRSACVLWISLAATFGGLRAARAEESTAEAASAKDSGWLTLFDGSSLMGWQDTNFGSPVQAALVGGAMELDFGAPLAGVNYVGNQLPHGNYELRLEAQRIEGTDFFCGLTFPVRDSYCSLILGGWGGSLVGLSCIDGKDASDNETRTELGFDRKQWYRVRILVTDKLIRAWVNDKRVVDQDIEKREISLRSEVLRSKPLGLCAFETRAAFRNIQWRPLPTNDASK